MLDVLPVESLPADFSWAATMLTAVMRRAGGGRPSMLGAAPLPEVVRTVAAELAPHALLPAPLVTYDDGVGGDLALRAEARAHRRLAIADAGPRRAALGPLAEGYLVAGAFADAVAPLIGGSLVPRSACYVYLEPGEYLDWQVDASRPGPVTALVGIDRSAPTAGTPSIFTWAGEPEVRVVVEPGIVVVFDARTRPHGCRSCGPDEHVTLLSATFDWRD